MEEQPRKPGRPKKQEEKPDLEREFASQLERYHAQPHWWITLHKQGDDDHVETETIGAAGVTYTLRKGERILIPESALNALKLAVREGLDLGHPIWMNGRKYFRKIKEPQHSYTLEGPIPPEEAAKWRAEQDRIRMMQEQLVPAGPGVGPDGGMGPDFEEA